VTEKGGFTARQSAHVTVETKADGDTWQETLAVCEMAGKLTIRSYYTNRRTNERKWDEPPSGASKVLGATETMRRMANIQLTEMQIATGTYKDPERENTVKKKKGVFGSLFRRGKTEQNERGKSRIQYKPDSFLRNSKREINQFDDNLNPAMQQALASSLAAVDENQLTADFEAPMEEGVELANEQILEFTKAMNINPSLPDPPASNEECTDQNDIKRDISQNGAPLDGSVVLHEVAFSEEEALEMALKLSLVEAEKTSNVQPTIEKEESPCESVASMPKPSENIEEEEGEIKRKEKEDINHDVSKTPTAESSKMPAVTDASALLGRNANDAQNAVDEALTNTQTSNAQGDHHFIFCGAKNPTEGKKDNPRNGRSKKIRERRRLTAEEVAAKEERMLQRAIKESMKDSQNTSEEQENENSDDGKEDSKQETKTSTSEHDNNVPILDNLNTDSSSQDKARRSQDLPTEKKDIPPKGHHRKARRSRGMTPEELAAKEERMLQRAIKESMKGSQNTSPSQGRALEPDEGLESSQHSKSSKASNKNIGRPSLSPQRERESSPQRATDISRAQTGYKKERKRSKHRRPTPEELAAKEEEMFQRALKASLEE